MFLTKQDFQKNVSRHDGKSKIVVKFHGVPIYTFCQRFLMAKTRQPS